MTFIQSTISFPKIPSPTKSPIHEYAAFSFNVNELPMFHFKIRSNSWWVGSQSRFLTGRVIYNGHDSHCTLHIVQLYIQDNLPNQQPKHFSLEFYTVFPILKDLFDILLRNCLCW